MFTYRPSHSADFIAPQSPPSTAGGVSGSVFAPDFGHLPDRDRGAKSMPSTPVRHVSMQVCTIPLVQGQPSI